MSGGSRKWPVPEGCQLRGLHSNVVVAHGVAHKVDLVLEEGALGDVALELRIAKSVEDTPNVAFMVSPRWAVDQDVVEVDNDKVVKKVAEELIHGPLERRRSIAQAKRHNAKLVGAIARRESSHGHAVGGHGYLVVAGTEVQRSKTGCVAETA